MSQETTARDEPPAMDSSPEPDAAIRRATRFANTKRRLQASFSKPEMAIQPDEEYGPVHTPEEALQVDQEAVDQMKARFQEGRARRSGV